MLVDCHLAGKASFSLWGIARYLLFCRVVSENIFSIEEICVKETALVQMMQGGCREAVERDPAKIDGKGCGMWMWHMEV